MTKVLNTRIKILIKILTNQEVILKMAVPKKKTSQSRKGMRRSHDALKGVNVTECQNCGTPKLSHHICGACGHYRGRQVFSAQKNSIDA